MTSASNPKRHPPFGAPLPLTAAGARPHTRTASGAANIATRTVLVRSVLRLALWLCALHISTAVHAQSSTPSDAQVQEARVLGRDAMALMQRKDYAGAERLLSAALALHPAPTLYLMRGEAREQQNKLLAASTDYQAAAQYPTTEAEHPKYAQARRDATTHLAQVKELIPRLTLRAHGKLVRVTVNGAAWPADSLPMSRSLDPGAYTIVSVDEDGKNKTERVTLTQRAHETLELSGTLPPSAAAELPQPSTRPRVDHTGTSYTVRYALGATTLAFTAAAIVTGIVALNKRADFHDKNRADVAMDEKLRLRSSASTWGWISTGLTGAALASAGTFAYVTFAPDGASGAAATLQLSGRF